MSLKSDDYNPSEAVERLIRDARYATGEPGWRVAGAEIEGFVRHEVARALLDAFSEAESLYINERYAQASQSSRTLLEGILAGVHIGKQSKPGEQ